MRHATPWAPSAGTVGRPQVPSSHGSSTSQGVVGVLVNGTAGTAAPGLVLVRDQVVRLRRATTAHAPSTVVLMAPGHGRRDLLLVPPEATERVAVSLMSAAGLTPEQRYFAS